MRQRRRRRWAEAERRVAGQDQSPDAGATVTVVDEDTEKKAIYQIVGEPEADAKKGKISITSPLARALIGKKKGASVEVVTPGGAKAYEITKIEWR